jgi:hypothetical protein
MLKVIAIGDVHADWGHLYGALKAAYAMDASGEPTQPVLDGRYRVILMGDLVHPKHIEKYEELTGRAEYNWRDPEHLKSASRAQVRELYKIKDFVDKAGGNVQVILGNHDDAALEHKFLLGTALGVIHAEFDPGKGGTPMPEDLQDWFRTFPRYVRLHGVHFAHAGPTPGMAYFDDFFYGDPDSKRWWKDKPHLVNDAGHVFGVYGHTVMEDGIFIDRDHNFAMIDALDKRQYLEMMFRDDESFDYRTASF